MIGLTQDIVGDIPENATLLGMDIGSKTIGFALAIAPYNIVTPLKTISRKKFSHVMIAMQSIVNDYAVDGFVIGYPLNMDDSAGKAAQSVKDFAQEMLNYPDIVGAPPWIALQDERLSTDTVHNIVDESDHFSSYKKEKDKGHIDALAAKIILEDAVAVLKQG